MRGHVKEIGSLLADYWYQQPSKGEMVLDLPAQVVFHPSVTREISLNREQIILCNLASVPLWILFLGPEIPFIFFLSHFFHLSNLPA